MPRLSDLERYLQNEISQGCKDSSGEFTLCGEKAVEKLAAFQLPGEHTWVLKFVQAAVVSGCRHLGVFQTYRETAFHFLGSPGFGLQEFENHFLDPEPGQHAGLHHLKQGLWSVSIHGMRPFQFMMRGGHFSLIWDGRQLLRQSASEPLRNCDLLLTVSHRSRQQGRDKRPDAYLNGDFSRPSFGHKGLTYSARA